MAPVLNTLRTCGLTLYLVICAAAAPGNSVEPWIYSIEVAAKNCVQNNCKYLLNVRGGEFLGHYSWRLTPSRSSRGVNCDTIFSNYEINELKTSKWFTKVELTVPSDEGRIYFCLHHSKVKSSPFGGNWIHQGPNLFLEPKGNDIVSKIHENIQATTIESSTLKQENLEENWKDLSNDIDVNNLASRPSEEEGNDIELFVNDQYVPLNDVNDIQNVDFNEIPADDVNDIRKRSADNDTDVNDEAYPLDEMVELDMGNSYDENSSFLIDDGEEGVPYILVTKDDVGIELNRYDSDWSFFGNSDAGKINVTDDENEIERSKREVGSDDDVNKLTTDDGSVKMRTERQAIDDFTSVKAIPQPIVVEGIRVEESRKEPKIVDNGIPSVLADSSVTLRLFGDGLTSRTVIAFTNHPQEYGQPCKFLLPGEYMVSEDTVTKKSALFVVTAPSPVTGPRLYLCTKSLAPGVQDLAKDEDKYVHQGAESWKVLATHNSLLPLWVSLCLILICLMFSALFSGLNLGLMSLDRTELKIISNTGTEQERKYARAIMPVRDHGNYLLCSILLGNVAVNSTFTILLDELTSGLFAVVFSTLAIVLLGEITPQAICSRHGLMVGARSIVVTKAVMAITAPLSYPVSKILDVLLGEEIGSVYNRERLKELVKVTTDVNDLDKDEVNIISGALELRKKTVSDVMTKLEDVFMLPISSVLDFETMSEIIKSGYSRIPVYEGGRGNIVTVLFIKDLAFVDPDDNTPLRTLCQYYQNPCNFVFEDVTLDVMFKQFKEGHKGHMAFVHRINNEGEGDPFYETIGLVTLEDVIEEMIQAEIVDETDVFLDNRSKRRRNKPQHKLQDFAAFAERHENQRIHISPQLTLATFQFLSTSVDAFRPDTVSETVLRRLLRQDVIQHIKLKGKTKKDLSTFVFQQGKPVDYFVLVLEGRVEVTVGRENLVFEAGPFTYFGVQALTQNIAVAESPTPSAMGSLQNINVDAMLKHTFIPDYSVRAITELFYMTVKRSLYLAAKRATLMEKGALSKGATDEQFDTEVDKHLCHASSANIPIAMISKKLLGKSTSTVSTSGTNADVFGSSSTVNKQSPRTNIIQLLQIQQNYASSERIDVNSYDRSLTNEPSRSTDRTNYSHAKYLPNNSTKSACETKRTANDGRTLAQSWSSPREFLDLNDHNDEGKQLNHALTKHPDFTTVEFNQSNHPQDFNTIEFKQLNSHEAKQLNRTHESPAIELKQLNMRDKSDEVCDECVKNNYWMTKSVLNKSVDDLKIHDNDGCKKKKTTFHTDSSLLSFHDLAPDDNEGIDEDSNRDCLEYPRCSLDESESECIDYELVSKSERESRAQTDRLVLARLARIIRMLERKDLLLEAVDEDISITGEHKTPSRQVSPNPLPVSASPLTRATFMSRTSPDLPRNGDLCARRDEQERLLKHTD